MTTPGSVTVTDRIHYTATVTPEQVAAWCGRVLGWERDSVGCDPVWILFNSPREVVSPAHERAQIAIPARATASDYSRRMAETVDALLGLLEVRAWWAEHEDNTLGLRGVRPSDILRAMAAEKVGDHG